jgi:hypothetical protein
MISNEWQLIAGLLRLRFKDYSPFARESLIAASNRKYLCFNRAFFFFIKNNVIKAKEKFSLRPTVLNNEKSWILRNSYAPQRKSLLSAKNERKFTI